MKVAYLLALLILSACSSAPKHGAGHPICESTDANALAVCEMEETCSDTAKAYGGDHRLCRGLRK